MIPETHRASASRTSRKQARSDLKSAKPAKTPARKEDVTQVASSVVAARHAAQHADIAREAYYRAERRGFMPGYELDDWLAAEAALNGSAPHAGVDDPAGSDSAYYHPASEI